MDKLTMQSADLVQDNVEKIGQLFPHVITEVEKRNGQLTKAVDFDLLRQELSDTIAEGDQEHMAREKSSDPSRQYTDKSNVKTR